MITDRMWALMEPECLGKPTDPGRTGGDGRLFMEAVLWIARTCSPLRDLPERFGKWNTVFKRFREWVKRDVFKRIFDALSEEPDMEYAKIDATIVKVHRHGQGEKGDSKPGYRQVQRRFNNQNTGPDRCLGNLVRFELLPGNRYDTIGVAPLIDSIEFDELLADKAFDANWIIEEMNERGAKICISQRPQRKFPLEIGMEVYKWRHLIENFFGKLKEFKRIALRSEKTDTSFAAMIYLASAIINAR